jgi:hypothetical protein
MLSKMANQIGVLAESVAFHSKVYTEFAALYWPLFSFTVSMEPSGKVRFLMYQVDLQPQIKCVPREQSESSCSEVQR